MEEKKNIGSNAGSNVELTRSRFLSFGVALGAGTAFAACGGGGTASDSSGGSSDSSGSSEGSAGSNQASGGEAPDAIASEADVPAGESLEFEEDGDPAVLVHLDSGDFVAYSALCTHQGCTVTYQNAELSCPCHGSVFDPADGGAVVNGPATDPLAEIPVEVQGGEVVRA